MSKEDSSAKSIAAGRPRSERARLAILRAARELIEEVGPTRLTVEGVAKRAKVGKPTIYRYWANAQELGMAAFVDHHTTEKYAHSDDTNLTDLYALIKETIARLDSKRGRQMALMLAGAEPDSELFKAFSNRVMLDGRERGAVILNAAISRGQINEDLDIDLCLDMIFGVIFLRLLIDQDPLGDDLADAAIALVLEGSIEVE